ncbi:hypothetical protein HID58_009779 [Brassica napus]|uniref:Glycolipid transfer protein domain-containing protein n=1 Tax=Brassica napus TaxID=3708 RepID=A0ABQ8DU83_BRANA|nr:hypothetical protein HID58_009779 [Brassica napus]
MADSNAERPLRKISTAFKELAATVSSPSPEVSVAQFSHACSLVSPLFGCLGIAFKFAQMDYVAKILQRRRVRGNNSLKDPASKSYDQVFRPHHGWVIQKAVALGMCALPTRSQLLTMLNEEEAEAKIHMHSYVNASAPVIAYLDNLFLSRQLGIDW